MTITLFVFAAVFIALQIFSYSQKLATFDEPVHMTAGYTSLLYHDYRNGPDNLPLLKRKYFNAATAFAVLFAGLALAPLAAERFRATYDICPWNSLYDSTGFRKTMLAIRSSIRKPLLLNVGERKNVQAMFYTGGPAYPFIPSPDKVKQLLNEGYGVIVLLDVQNTNQEAIEELVKGGLVGQVQFLSTYPPEQVARVSPYFN